MLKLNYDKLPKVIPIFPLSGALLLPKGCLPLNIFEPRYLSMTDFALGNGRFIGMIQPKTGEGKFQNDSDSIYSVGSLGRIASFSEEGEFRYSITLVGVSRFRIIREIDSEDAWRTVEVGYESFSCDTEISDLRGFSRESFLNTLQDYFAANKVTGSWEVLKTLDTERLISSVAMLVLGSPEEQQEILEVQSVGEQGQMVQSLMERVIYNQFPEKMETRH